MATSHNFSGWLERLPVRRKGLLLVAVPLLFQLAFGALVIGLGRVHRLEREREVDTREVIATAYELLGLMVDTETAMRGYVLTGNGVFLEPYDTAVAVVPNQVRRLRALTRSSDGTAIDRVESTASVALGFSSEMLRLMRAGQREAAVASITQLDGKRRMDAFRAATQAFIGAEERVAAAAAVESRNAESRLTTALAAGSAANVLIALTLAYLFTRGITSRLAYVARNTDRIARDEPLPPVLAPGDEIALLDRRLHETAEAIAGARQRLETANQELSAFSYSISHDLRAPIRAIDGYARMLVEDCGDELPPDGTRYLVTIRSEAARMGRLIDDLLSFAKLTRTGVAQTDVDVAALTDEVFAEIVDGSATAAELSLEDLPLARADRAMLRQVLVNLLSNAVKFSRNAEHPRVSVEGRSDGAENVYVVRDNGIGFDMRYADKLFGVFQRLHKFDEFEGTGVGLAIVHRVITRHGGRVWAESAPGAGASFFFTLPAAAGTPTQEKERECNSSGNSDRRRQSS